MSTQLILDIPAARQARDNGINQAKTHADEVSPGWSETAYLMFKDWLKGWQPGFKFLMEDFRQICKIRRLPDPPTGRAFGHIAVRARKEGLIKSNDQRATKSKTAHRCYSNEWQKL